MKLIYAVPLALLATSAAAASVAGNDSSKPANWNKMSWKQKQDWTKKNNNAAKKPNNDQNADKNMPEKPANWDKMNWNQKQTWIKKNENKKPANDDKNDTDMPEKPANWDKMNWNQKQTWIKKNQNKKPAGDDKKPAGDDKKPAADDKNDMPEAAAMLKKVVSDVANLMNRVERIESYMKKMMDEDKDDHDDDDDHHDDKKDEDMKKLVMECKSYYKKMMEGRMDRAHHGKMQEQFEKDYPRCAAVMDYMEDNKDEENYGMCKDAVYKAMESAKVKAMAGMLEKYPECQKDEKVMRKRRDDHGMHKDDKMPATGDMDADKMTTTGDMDADKMPAKDDDMKPKPEGEPDKDGDKCYEYKDMAMEWAKKEAMKYVAEKMPECKGMMFEKDDMAEKREEMIENMSEAEFKQAFTDMCEMSWQFYENKKFENKDDAWAGYQKDLPVCAKMWFAEGMEKCHAEWEASANAVNAAADGKSDMPKSASDEEIFADLQAKNPECADMLAAYHETSEEEKAKDQMMMGCKKEWDFAVSENKDDVEAAWKQFSAGNASCADMMAGMKEAMVKDMKSMEMMVMKDQKHGRELQQGLTEKCMNTWENQFMVENVAETSPEMMAAWGDFEKAHEYCAMEMAMMKLASCDQEWQAFKGDGDHADQWAIYAAAPENAKCVMMFSEYEKQSQEEKDQLKMANDCYNAWENAVEENKGDQVIAWVDLANNEEDCAIMFLKQKGTMEEVYAKMNGDKADM